MSLMRKLRIISGAGAVTVFAFYSAPHVFPQFNRKILEMKPKQVVTDDHRSLFVHACQQMDIPDPDKIALFYNAGFSTISAGSCRLPNKAVIGLPRTFLLKNEDELRIAGVKYQDRVVNWNSKSGEALAKALMSNNGQISFVMAHELAHIKGNDFLLRGLMASAWFYASCRVLMYIVPRAKASPTIGRKALLSILLCFVSLYGFNEADKYVRCELEYRADKRAANCGIEYKNGGINYLNARLRMNRVLRHLTGVSGVQRYTPKGNDLYDTAHPLITDRIERLKEIRIS
eukprot:gene15363-16940_t